MTEMLDDISVPLLERFIIQQGRRMALLRSLVNILQIVRAWNLKCQLVKLTTQIIGKQYAYRSERVIPLSESLGSSVLAVRPAQKSVSWGRFATSSEWP